MVKTLSGSSPEDGGSSGDSAMIFEYMRLRAAESRYLNKEEEWKIIDNAIFQLGLRPVDAKSYLVGAAVCGNYSTESLVKRTLLDIARGLRKRSDRISKEKFEFMVEATLGLANNEISEAEAQELVKTACDLVSLKAGRSGILRSRRWYRAAGSNRHTQPQPE